ncbi:MAG: twin-arginine translocase TatA/TatE family subunit [Chloroflexi bacterium AL-W]|nr:twin-arginine translocase TatA/TatE family subunit [Chloroflexi bacterium AL-N1]NOK66917.1 twin-arginine translocase TatA/TatE family subunit [Chloroflexi bacterium AL-N10]NOK74791.1 twin-arginine translocase TatA/TatE family subunit [Chloroflexi bacterium AL-N5]NOK81519.1 twin-arginine translocase TatA/TatE family subunit [Chloroflexi bacterium AL-W]NOK88989.1 twin-arginine translocase TatA/TatE family subunit [Chloroflexi bacterium AL-N15]
MPIGIPELLIILLILIMLFGATRLKGIGGALGGSIREFKTAVRDEKEEAAELIEKNEQSDKQKA